MQDGAPAQPKAATGSANVAKTRTSGTPRLLATCTAAICATLLLGATPLAGPPAQARVVTHQLDIAAQDLGAALKALGAAANEQILFSDDVVAGLRSPQLKGAYSTDDAIKLLLESSGLKADRTPSGVLLIRSRESTSPEETARPTTSVAEPAKSGGARLAENRGGLESGQIPEEMSEGRVMDEVLVTGTHIRGPGEYASLLATITRADIAKTGYSTVEGLFRDLPQSFAEINSEGPSGQGLSRLAAFNSERASAIDLRGIGAGSTLTLLNGQRRAGSIDGRVVDVSAIPLSVIERVEIAEGGRSAIYGSDAVAGVVNLITRYDFEGLESQVTSGRPTGYGGGRQHQASSIGGWRSSQSGFVAAYDFQREDSLDLLKTGLVVSPTPLSGDIPRQRDLRPDTRRHSLYLAGHLQLSDRLELRADGLYTDKTFDSLDRWVAAGLGAITESFTSTEGTGKHYSAAAGARIDLNGAWALDVAAGASAAKSDVQSEFLSDFGPFGSFSGNSDISKRAALRNLTAIFDGPLPELGGITPHAAVGAELRRESFDSSVENVPDPRDVHSAFLELSVPLFPLTGTDTHAIDLSLAARYDRYDDFGDTFNPQAGVIWHLGGGFRLRGAYSTSFRAPALVELESDELLQISLLSDPGAGGFSPVLERRGAGNPDLDAEAATTWSAGIDFHPALLPSLRMSLSYFDIAYKERLDNPAFDFSDRQLVLEREARYPGLLDRAPTEAELADIIGNVDPANIFNFSGIPFDPATQSLLEAIPNIILFDNRLNNIARERVNGLDLRVAQELTTPFGLLNFGLNATHTLDHTRSVTQASPAFDLLNEVGKPVDLRVRATAGLTQNALGIFLYANYVDSYADPFSTPAGKISSWTTFDLTLRYQSFVDVALSVDNLFDRRAPAFVNNSFGLRYDPANADPLGRFATLRLSKRW